MQDREVEGRTLVVEDFLAFFLLFISLFLLQLVLLFPSVHITLTILPQLTPAVGRGREGCEGAEEDGTTVRV